MFRIVRNDITRMTTEAVVNTANQHVAVGEGCDSAVYEAAGCEELLAYRRDKIGEVPEGEVFLTPGFRLPAKYIIHAVSPKYVDGEHGEEKLLRSCYRKSLALAKEKGIRSIAIPLIATGSFGYPKEEGMRIAVDEISGFLSENRMEILLVVFDDDSTRLGEKIYPDLEEYIRQNYVEEKKRHFPFPGMPHAGRREDRDTGAGNVCYSQAAMMGESVAPGRPMQKEKAASRPAEVEEDEAALPEIVVNMEVPPEEYGFEEFHESRLDERMRHLSDTFSEYLLYLIRDKHMENAEVYKRAIVDKKTFSKIKNHADYHPQKLTALCLCVGAKLNLDESKDLLARAGYALSPCDKTDIIFSYFIENEIYDMIELDIQLEEHGLPCIIT